MSEACPDQSRRANPTADNPEPALERERRAALRFQAEQRRHDLIRKSILGLRAANRTMPVKEIAYRVGVSADYVEQVLAQAAGPR